MNSLNNSTFSLDLSFNSNSSVLSEPENQPESIEIDLSNGSPLNTDNFLAIHYNVNSILTEGRLEELVDNIRILKANIIVCTESKLDETIDSKLISIDGFHAPIRSDRNRHGGGCLIYISNSFTFKQQPKLQSKLFEHIWVDIRANNKIYTINCYYRPPNIENHAEFLQESEIILTRLNQHKADEILIMSDLNFGNIYSKYPILVPKPLDTLAPELFTSFGFKQLIDIPTRIATTKTANGPSICTSLIDLVFTHNLNNIQSHGTLPPLADHQGTFVAFHCIKSKQSNITKEMLDYKNMDEKGLINFIKTYDFQSNVFSKPTLEQAPAFSEVIVKAIKTFIPTKKITIRSTDQPWVNSYTRLLIRKKNRNYHIFKKIHSAYMSNADASPELVTRLKIKRDKAQKRADDSSKESTKANRRAKESFFNTVNATMHNSNISAKKKFKILTKLMKNQKTSYMPPLIQNDKIVNDPKDKSEILNDIFAAKATVTGNDDPVPELEPLENVLTNLNTINTSPLEIAQMLRIIKQSNSSHCGIPGKVLNIISTPSS
jgi:hypothetical protein